MQTSKFPAVDVAVLSRDTSPLDPRVERAITGQSGIQVKIHRVIGTPIDSDQNRYVTIARARNVAKSLGTSNWFMFVDDDVVIPQGCIERLLQGISANHRMGAVAANYSDPHTSDGRLHHHVTMGATLFRRRALSSIEFRECAGRCECRSCCADLRRQNWGIRYLPGLKANHLPRPRPKAFAPADQCKTPRSVPSTNYILTAFDARDYEKFQTRFLSTLRSSGNNEHVIAVASGLSSEQKAQLRTHPNLTVVDSAPSNRHLVERRFRDFSNVVQALPSSSRVAYWDAGDVVFQRPLTDLWNAIDRNPSRIALVPESLNSLTFTLRRKWILQTRSNTGQARLLRLLRNRPVINGGFAAGTVDVFRKYVDDVDATIESKQYLGSGWGWDQIALMAHCYSTNCHAFVDDGWNYCIAGRPAHETEFSGDGTIRRSNGEIIPVVHGTGGTLDSKSCLPVQVDGA